MMRFMKCFNKAMSNSVISRRKLQVPVREMSEISSLFNPTDEHQSLRNMVRSFVEAEVEPQALEFNKNERFNIELFRKLGELGLLGITVEPEYGGSGMDAVAAVIVHGTNIITLDLVFPLISMTYLQVGLNFKKTYIGTMLMI